MQAAYASGVKISSARHLTRMRRLRLLLAEVGGPTALAVKVASPKSHLSALAAGSRGMGDTLAAKLERKCDKPPGWMDLPVDDADSDRQAEPLLYPGEMDLLHDFRRMTRADKIAMIEQITLRARTADKLRIEFGVSGPPQMVGWSGAMPFDEKPILPSKKKGKP